MKTFNDFLATLTPSDISKIKEDVLAKHEPEPATDAIVNLSFEISLKLIEKYHNWLNQ